MNTTKDLFSEVNCIDCAICYHTFVYTFAVNIYIKNSAYYKGCLFHALLLSAINLIFIEVFLVKTFGKLRALI